MDRSFTQYDRFLRLIGGYMNFRKLLTCLTVSTAAVIPFASAQNPTILQGSYISNVFGNSNFVLNPNAQTNVANVTTVTATVARSTTTPLVATSEFTVAIGTANGTATWATRAFDAGMKNQNCEARFTYRGFQATSKVQIKQSTNVVAELVLTPSATDPRIASINFPCGDLSAATTFVVTDTAILAGTNEIGGIYVGLATNMANVAQAEFVGSLTFGSDCEFPRTSNTYGTPTDASCTTTPTGNVAVVSGVKSGITINDTRPGTYRIVFNTSQWFIGVNDCRIQVTDGTTVKPLTWQYQAGGTSFLTPASHEVFYQYTTSGTRTIEYQLRSNNNVDACTFSAGGVMNHTISVYRFPSASELVVTPERQNTFAGVQYRGLGGGNSVHGGATAPTVYSAFNNAIFNQPTMLKGKASLATSSSNDLGFSVANLPVGSYSVQVSGFLQANIGGGSPAGSRSRCNFRIRETTTSTIVAQQSHQDNAATAGAGIVATRDYTNSLLGVFSNNSVATRNFVLEAQKFSDTTSTNGFCEVWSDNTTNFLNTDITILLTPLDQPSNSALYVQGPVKAAETGAAIPEGYVNEFATREITDTSLRQQSTPTVATWYYPWTGELTLPAGNWNLCYSVVAQHGQTGSTSYADIQTRIQNKTDDTTVILDFHSPAGTPGNITGSIRQSASCKPIAITSSKTFRVGIKYTNGSGTPTVSNLYLRGDLNTSRLYAIRLN